MGRQSSGLGLVIVVLLAAVSVPAIAGREISGNAVALPIPTAPQVGGCLLDAPLRFGIGAVPVSVPCTSAHDAEVISKTATVFGRPTSKKGGGDVPDAAACARTAYWYLGVHPLDGAGNRSAVLGPWWPAFSASLELFVPSDLQTRVGQSWIACVMRTSHGSTFGSVAHLFGGPPRLSPIALCTPRSEIVLNVAIPCDQPHPTEIVGWRVAAENTNAEESFDQSCAELARRITGMADPTAQGALRSAVVFLSSEDGAIHEGWGPGRAAPYRAACTLVVTTERLLTGSLTGLGSAPVPWG